MESIALNTENTAVYQLVEKLKEKGWKIASAESLTGGFVSAMITSVPGASEVFECGICSYSNRIKHKLVGVGEDVLEQFTEYSEETAMAMAKGVRELSGADIGIATTGIAGPGGGTKEKPVGTVYIGVSTKEKTAAVRLSIDSSQYDRRGIRLQTAQQAIALALSAADGI